MARDTGMIVTIQSWRQYKQVLHLFCHGHGNVNVVNSVDQCSKGSKQFSKCEPWPTSMSTVLFTQGSFYVQGRFMPQA